MTMPDIKDHQTTKVADLLKDLGAHRVQLNFKGDDFQAFFAGDVVGLYDGVRRETIELGPIRLPPRDGNEIIVYVGGVGFLTPKVRDELVSLSRDEILACVFGEGQPLPTETRMFIRRYESRSIADHECPSFHPDQWVLHKMWGMGRFRGNVIDSDYEAIVRFDTGDHIVSRANLTPAAHLGKSWSFEFAPPSGPRQMSAVGRAAGTHVRVVVRSGTPGSRALLGSLVMTVEEADVFRAIVGGAGAVVDGSSVG